MSWKEISILTTLFAILAVGSSIVSQPDPCDHSEYEQKIEQLRYERDHYRYWADTLQYNQDSVLVPYIMGWEDHAIRMRRIAGYPDDQIMTWEWKCIQPVETRRIVGRYAVD